MLQVETIGDAYMAVGGLHRKDKDHGRSTTSMGVAMVQYANTVLTPEGEKIEVSLPETSGHLGFQLFLRLYKCLLLNHVTYLIFNM